MDFEKYINNLRHDTTLKMFKNMDEICNDEEHSYFIKDYINYMENKHNVKKVNYIQSDVSERLAKVDEIVFRKAWNKLAYEHKRIKIKQYLSTRLLEVDEDNLNEIKVLINKDFENKKLNTSKTITYDPITTLILGIEGLDYDSKENIYTYKSKS